VLLLNGRTFHLTRQGNSVASSGSSTRSRCGAPWPGNVRPRGDGIVVIAELIGLDKKEFTPLLTNPSFRVNMLTFDSNATGR
jgi:hypothetical protein